MTIRPYACAFIAGSTAFVSRKAAARLTSIARRHSSAEISRIGSSRGGRVVHQDVHAAEAVEHLLSTIAGTPAAAISPRNSEDVVAQLARDQLGPLGPGMLTATGAPPASSRAAVARQHRGGASESATRPEVAVGVRCWSVGSIMGLTPATAQPESDHRIPERRDRQAVPAGGDDHVLLAVRATERHWHGAGAGWELPFPQLPAGGDVEGAERRSSVPAMKTRPPAVMIGPPRAIEP